MNMHSYIVTVILSFSLLTHLHAGADEAVSMNNKLQQDLSVLSQARLYFGHMSVGGNIIDGVKEILAETKNININILERSPSTQFTDKFLLHSSIGKNTEPLSKCLDFKNIIETELKEKIDFAMFKFCYIDITENTDIVALFTEYRKIMDNLISAYPDISFVHITAALRHTESGPSIWIREFLGRPNNSKLANIKRNQFNQLLRDTYKDQPIFDLAESQSTFPNGKKETFRYHGDQDYNTLIGSYTHDGRHLNATGRRKVAGDFISRLADIIRKTERKAYSD